MCSPRTVAYAHWYAHDLHRGDVIHLYGALPKAMKTKTGRNQSESM